ncbi:MAG: acyl-CoA synthetase [Betaproteobacteria bacterium]|nr:acyl-CoA synthetase [Betaproteobacteria bacterium]
MRNLTDIGAIGQPMRDLAAIGVIAQTLRNLTAIGASGQPLRDLADIEAIERVPLEERIFSWNVNDWIRRGCERDPGKTALLYLEDADPFAEPVTLSFAELSRRSTQVANLFHSLGVGARDPVAYLLPTLPQLYVVQLAALAAGIACSLNWMLKPEQLLELIRASRAKVVVALAPTPGFEIWENLQAIRAQLPEGVRVLSVRGPGGTLLADSDLDSLSARQPGERLRFARAIKADDIAGYVHSGGTTGSPKLVQLTHRGFVYKCWSIVEMMAHLPGDRIFADYPMFHIAGFVGRGIMPIACGMSILIPTPLGARSKTFIANYWKLVERYGITIFSGVPTTLSVLVKNPPRGEDISSLRPYATTGSTGLPVETSQQIERVLGIRMLLTYGATEYTSNVTQPPRDGEQRHGSAGLRIPYTQVKTVELDRHGGIARGCAAGEIGVVVIKGPGITPGYVDARYNAGLFMADGWFNSGDLGRIDADGYLWLTGRARDVIIRGGHNIDPALIEETLLRHPAVLLAAAVGKPDAYAGELPVAYVQLTEGARVLADELAAFVREHISERAAAPGEIHILEHMPLTDIAKPHKPQLRQDAARRAFEAALAGVARAGGECISVSVAADAEHGTLATVRVSGGAAGATSAHARTAMAQAIGAVMNAYTMRHVVAWGEGSSGRGDI